MDTTASILTTITLASIITTSGLTIHLTENFGTLAKDEQVKKEVNGDKLVGPYGNAVTGMSAVVIGLSAVYMIFFIYGWYKNRHNHSAHIQRIYWLVMVLAVILGVCSAGMNLNLTEEYWSIEGIVPDPNPIVAGENYRLRGSYGIATLGMAISALSISSMAFIWMFVLFFQNMHHMTRSKSRSNL